MVRSPAPLVEKMTLFWHGHFATSADKVSAYRMWLQNETIRRYALSSFNTLVKAISCDPAMLNWLDLGSSQKEHPNENFARELMELFTLGEGHYTEDDVKAAARSFTGLPLRFGERTCLRSSARAGRSAKSPLACPYPKSGAGNKQISRHGIIDGRDGDQGNGWGPG